MRVTYCVGGGSADLKKCVMVCLHVCRWLCGCVFECEVVSVSLSVFEMISNDEEKAGGRTASIYAGKQRSRDSTMNESAV